MQRLTSQAHPVLGLVLAASLLGALAASLASPLDAQAVELAPVAFGFEAGGEPCITVQPESVTIYVQTKPNGVEWTVTGKDPAHLWLIEYEPEKAGADAEHFGARFRIPCGDKDSVRSGAATRPGTWPYSVSVFQCPENGQPAPNAEPICRVDPEVIIRDTPGGG